MPYVALPLSLFVQSLCTKAFCTGISFVDSTTLDVCDSHRIQQQKVFQGITKKEKSSTGSMALNFTLLSMTVEKYGACACPGQCGWPKLESYETPNKRYFRESVCWQRVCFQKAIWETPGYRCRANHQTEEEYKKTEHDAFHRLASLAEACYDRVSQWLFEEYLPD